MCGFMKVKTHKCERRQNVAAAAALQAELLMVGWSIG
jgi:hypothetical protein